MTPRNLLSSFVPSLRPETLPTPLATEPKRPLSVVGPFPCTRGAQDHTCPIGMGIIPSQVRRRGVMSVWGTDAYHFMERAYEGIKNKRFNGVEFEQHIWIRPLLERTVYWCGVCDPFNLPHIALRILLDSYSENNQTEEMTSLRYEEPEELLQRCRKLLRERDCLVVIADLQSTDDWDQIQAAIFPEPIKGCIVVITDLASVAKHCVDDEDRALDVKYLVFEAALRPSVTTSKKNRMEEAKDWTNKNELFERWCEENDLRERLWPHRHKRRLAPDRDEEKTSLRLEDCSVSVWGIAGVGKSALVRSIYYDALLQQEKYRDDFVMFSWVDVPDQFNLTDLSRSLLLDFHSDNLQAKETAAIGIMEGQDPIQGCWKILRQYRCLVVIDGLRSTQDWDLIKDAFLSEPNKSCIVVITNEESVATHCANKVVNVKCLQANAALELFTKVALDRGWPLSRPEFAEDMERSKLVAAKAGGLPKAIVAIGQYLFPGDGIMNCYSGNENYARLDTLRGLFSWMQSYFDACSDSLKPCIFYLSVFPADHNIKRRRLLTRWIAEGYSRDTFGSNAEDYSRDSSDSTLKDCYSRDRSGITAEENGEKFLDELIKLSIILQSAPRNVYQVNGLFHGYIISQPMEDNLVFALDNCCGLNSQRTGQHLTIRSTWKRERIVFESIDFSRLRSLTVFGKWEPFLISAKMERLRVLDLEDTSGVTDEDLKQILKLLRRLKFLSLRGCREISRLPDTLGGLRQLQTLDVRHTTIVTLPLAICKLTKLQYIRVGNTEPWYEGDGMVTTLPAVHEDRRSTPLEDGDGTVPFVPPALAGEVQTSTPSLGSPRTLVSWLSKFARHRLVSADNGGVKVPTGIGKLTALHNLGVVNVSGADGKAILKELKDLTQLRRLKVSGINRGNIHPFFSAISGHCHLESLSVRLDEDMQDGLDDILQPRQRTVKHLKLYGNVLNLPVWIEKFVSLEILNIEMTITTTTPENLRLLVELASRDILRRLCVKLIQDGEFRLDFPEGSDLHIIKLQDLKIDCSSRVKVIFPAQRVDYLWGLWGNVKVLGVRCSSGSDLQFAGLEYLMSLEEVWLMGSYDDKLRQELQQQLSNHQNKPVLKLVQPRSW